MKIQNHKQPLFIIAAGGLGSRMKTWSSFIPKEFLPLNHRPGIFYLLEELIRLQVQGRIVYVYNPYYEPFYKWVEELIVNKRIFEYNKLIKKIDSDIEFLLDKLPFSIEFIPEDGPYSDLSSIITCKEYIHNDNNYIIYADNVYINESPLKDLMEVAESESCLVGKQIDKIEDSRLYGVVKMSKNSGAKTCDVLMLKEKPSHQELQTMMNENNFIDFAFNQSRFKLTQHFIDNINLKECMYNNEPKLSVAIDNYVKKYSMKAIITNIKFNDLGLPRT